MTDRKPMYYELLRDPRWQRKRLEIMERADFACEYCDDTASTLNVHHLYYEKNHHPWDYPSEALICICEDCHLALHQTTKTIQSLSVGMGWAFWERLVDLAHELRDEHRNVQAIRDRQPPSRRLYELSRIGSTRPWTPEEYDEALRLIRIRDRIKPLMQTLKSSAGEPSAENA